MNNPTASAFFYFLKRYKLLFGAIVLLTFVSSALESFGVAAFFPLFSTLVSDAQDEGGLLGFINRVVGSVPVDSPIIAASVLIAGIFFLKAGSSLLLAGVVGYTSAKVLYNTKKEMMDKYAGAHYQYFLDSRQGDLIFNLTGATPSISSALDGGARLVMSLFRTISMTVILVAILPFSALAVALLGLTYYGFIHYASRRFSYPLGQRQARTSSEQLVVANEFFSGFRQILTFNAARHWVARFDLQNRTFSESLVKVHLLNAIPRPAMELSTLALMVGFILYIWSNGQDNLAESLAKLGVFVVALVQLMPALTSIGATRMGIMGTLPNLELVHQTLTGSVPMRKDGYRDLEPLARAIAFEGVSFAYKGRETLLDGVNLTFEKGKVTAIVGASGGGKTTIVNLILGLFEPTGGRITVDGVPLQDIKQEAWLSKIGSVSQDSFTFHSTIANNILLGRNGHSTESIIKAAKIANAHEFIAKHPHGYDVIVGDRGMRLSGGQQQRLAIARAVLDTPEILIFDEATSSLDTAGEKLVQEAINNVSTERTVIIIAHRLSTVRNADKIIVIDNGRVVEEGTHEELLSKNGNYSHLVTVAG